MIQQRIRIAMNDAVYNYFKDINLSSIVDDMLETYNITEIPELSHTIRTHYRDVIVTNPEYLRMRSILGVRDPQVNLSRLFEWAYAQDYLNEANYKVVNSYKTDLLKAKMFVLKAKSILNRYDVGDCTDDLLTDINEYIMEADDD